MAETFDNEEAAYAMDKTGRFFPIAHEVQAKTPEQRKWWDAREAFQRMTSDEQFAWLEGVGKYPAMEDVLTPRVNKTGRA